MSADHLCAVGANRSAVHSLRRTPRRGGRRPFRGSWALAAVVASTLAAVCIAAIPAGTAEGPDAQAQPVASQLAMPSPAEPSVPANVGPEPASVQHGIYKSVQVNVDERGRNIPGDGANTPSIAIDPTNPDRIVIGWQENHSPYHPYAGYGYSHDGGRNWTFPGVLEPDTERSNPVLDAGSDGTFYYLTMACDYRDCGDVYRSVDGGIGWERISNRAGGGFLPWMVVDRTGGEGDGHLYIGSAMGGAERSVDGGLTFGRRSIPGEPRYGTIAVGPRGEVYTFGRPLFGDVLILARSTTARLKDAPLPQGWGFGGIDYSLPVDVAGNFRPGSGFAGRAWIAVDRSDGPFRGNVYALSSAKVKSLAVDVQFNRSENGGVSWARPTRVNEYDDDQREHWFGTLAVAPDGRLDAIWNETDPEGQTRLHYAYSVDGGRTWAQEIVVSPPFSSAYPGGPPVGMGTHYGMISEDRSACVAYTATFNEEQDIYFLRIPAHDCNQNGVDDRKEIQRGLLEDCTANGLPDVCERDCNGNLRADSCDIAADIEQDCNGNGVPDSCDISRRDSLDCSGNGVPDECEPDCNRNGLADSCDIARGDSLDRDGNGTPDECEPDRNERPHGGSRLYVHADAPPGGDGRSWKTAFNDLQQALDRAWVGQEVWVARGVYRPAEPNGPREASFQIKSGVAVYGGFDGTERRRDDRRPVLNPTILSGDLNGDDDPKLENYSDNAYTVVQFHGCGPATVLDGVAVSDGGTGRDASGILISSGSPTIADVIIRDCRGTGVGVTSDGHAVLQGCTVRNTRLGLFTRECRVTLTDCRFEDNRETAVRVWGSSSGDWGATITGCAFVQNMGGGVQLQAGDGVTHRVVRSGFFGNTSSEGGAIGYWGLREGSLLVVDQCVFSGNVASREGGAVAALGGFVVTQSTFAYNGSVDGKVGGLRLTCDHHPATISGSVFSGNYGASGVDQNAQVGCGYAPPGVTVAYSLIDHFDTPLGGSANIAGDPLFVSPRGRDGIIGTEDDDLRLRAGSPCIDASTNDFLLPDVFDLDKDGDVEEPTPYDLDGQIRRFDDPATPDTGWGYHPPIADMGAYEWSGVCEAVKAVKAKCKPDGVVRAKVKSSLEEGRWVTATLNGDDPMRIDIDSRGRGKAKWSRLTSGTHEICLRECPRRCREAACP